MSHFAYLLYPTRPGFAPETLTPEEDAVIGRHFAYLEGLLAKGQLLLAGPCLDGSLGLGIFETETEAEARGLMAADPAVVAGVFRAEVRPMRVSLLRQG